METTKKQVQIGWIFTGADVVTSTGYRKEHFFPADVSVSRDRRGQSWSSEPDDRPDQIHDIVVRTGSEWDYKHDNGTIGKKFEVMQIERMGGKITTTAIMPKPYMMEVEVEEEELPPIDTDIE